MGESNKKENWDFKVPETSKSRIKERVESRTGAAKNPVKDKVLDPSRGSVESLSKAREKLQSPGKNLSIEDTEKIRKKRTTRSKLAEQYEFEDRLEKLVRTPPIDRLFAGVIDLAYIGIISFSAQFFIPMAHKEYMKYLREEGINQMLPPEVLNNYIWMGLIVAALFVLYFIPTFLFGKSVGKIMRGHRIGHAKDGLSVSRGVVLIREFILRPLSLITVVGVALMFFNEKKQGLHDILLKTSVYSD